MENFRWCNKILTKRGYQGNFLYKKKEIENFKTVIMENFRGCDKILTILIIVEISCTRKKKEREISKRKS